MSLTLKELLFHYEAPPEMPVDRAIAEVLGYTRAQPGTAYILTHGGISIVIRPGRTHHQAMRLYRRAFEALCPSPATGDTTASTTPAAGPAAPGAP